MAMTLQLTTDQAEELGKALETYLGDLRMEIAGTDSWDYRESLKARRNVLSQLLRQMRPEGARG
jgi:hypothetical protein